MNVHELDCKSESDVKDHASKKNDHLMMSCPMSKANANGWENDITDTRMKEGENFASITDWKITDGSTLAAPAIISHSAIQHCQLLIGRG
jgi:hypothetical protein